MYAFHRWPSASLVRGPRIWKMPILIKSLTMRQASQNGEPFLYSPLGSASGDTPRGPNPSPTYPSSFPHPSSRAPPPAGTPAKHRHTRTCDASGTRESIVGFDLGSQGRRDAGERCSSRTGVVCHRICAHVEEEVGRLVLACRRHCPLCRVACAKRHHVRTCLAKLQPYSPSLACTPHAV
jgi:hypothetical protein